MMARLHDSSVSPRKSVCETFINMPVRASRIRNSKYCSITLTLRKNARNDHVGAGGRSESALLPCAPGGNDEVRLVATLVPSGRIMKRRSKRFRLSRDPIRLNGRTRGFGPRHAASFGTERSLAYELCQAIKRVLCKAEMSTALSKRGADRLHSLCDGLPVFDPAGTTVERLATGRSRWWTFAGARANWLLWQALHRRGSSMRIDDFYIEMKGTMPIAAMRERLQTLKLGRLSKTLMPSKAIDLKFRDAVPENPGFHSQQPRV